jgi:hypothetical protein
LVNHFRYAYELENDGDSIYVFDFPEIRAMGQKARPHNAKYNSDKHPLQRTEADSCISPKAHRLIEKALSVIYVALSALYTLYIVFKFRNLQTDGLFPGIAALIAINIAYINTLFNRARATELDRVKRRSIAAAETSLRGLLLLLASTFALSIEYSVSTMIMQLPVATQPLQGIVPTYPALAFIALLTAVGVMASIILTLKSILILIRRDFGVISVRSIRKSKGRIAP